MKVSVIMITYGHEKYIAEAINSVLMQSCNFEIELLVANDRSPDNTDAVIQSILKENPNSFRLKYINREHNMGIMPNLIDTLSRAEGEYIALCDGDDYWTDSNKLQKQIDFLEANPDFSMCCHNAEVIYEGIAKSSHYFNDSHDSNISMETIINKWIIPTASIVFRRAFIINLPQWFGKIYSADFSLALLSRYHGNVKFFAESMSVYRVNYSGSSASATVGKKFEFVSQQHTLLLNYFNEYTNFAYDGIIKDRVLVIENEVKFFRLRQKGMLFAFLGMPATFLKKVIEKIAR